MEPKVPELGRFAEPALLILVSLSDGPKHGYAMMAGHRGRNRPAAWVPERSTRRWPGSRSEGLIEALPPVERRRPYRLTAVGATNLAEQLRGLAEFAQLGLRRLGQTES